MQNPHDAKVFSGGLIRRPHSEDDLTKAGDQFRQSDVTFWGFAALACGVVAVLSANVSALIPEGTFLSLHLSRLEGGSITELRQKVAELSVDAARLRQDARQTQSQIKLTENTSGEIARRVGALEVTLPALVEAMPGAASLDHSILTSSIADDPEREIVPTDGGAVSVKQTPLAIANSSEQKAVAAAQPIPQALPAAQFGIALGPAIASTQASATWDALNVKLGDILAGLEPVMNGGTAAEDGHLIAGPFADVKDATALCKRLEAVAVACLPVPYIGATITN